MGGGDFDIRELVEGGDFLALDVEGDGNDGQRPVEISFVRFSSGKAVEEFHYLVNPERPISSYVSVLHGITDETVASAPVFEDVRAEIEGHLRSGVIVAHNIRDDMRLLSSVIPDVLLLPEYMVDTVRMGRNLVKESLKYNLDDLSEALGIAEDEPRDYPLHTDFPSRGGQRHSSGMDAYLAGRCLVEMAARIDPSPKKARHFSRAALYVINDRQRAALEELRESPQTVPTAGVPRV